MSGARAKRGFTIIEMVTVVMVVSVVTRIAVPQMQEVLSEAARAAGAVAPDWGAGAMVIGVPAPWPTPPE